MLSRLFFISRPVLFVEFGQEVRAAISTVHIQLEHSITGSVCLCLLEFSWERNETYFIAVNIPCVMCNFSYFTFNSCYSYIFCLVLTLNTLEFVCSASP